MPKPRARALLIAVTASSAVFLPTLPSRADCVYVEFYITRAGNEPIYPLGEDPCVYPTEYETLTSPLDEHTQHGAPDQAPNGYYIKVGVPAP